MDLPDEGGVHDGGHDADGDGLLLRSLATGGTTPSKDERVHAVGADGEDDHGGVAPCNANRCTCDEESDGGDALRDGDMPGALVEFTR